MLAYCTVVAGLAATALAGALPADIVVRNAPGMSSADTVHAIYQRLEQVRRDEAQEIYSSTASLNSSFSNAVLLKIKTTVSSDSSGPAEREGTGSIEIFCNTCYVKGEARASLTVGGTLDIGAAFDNLTTQFGGAVEEIATGVIDFFQDMFDDGIGDEISDLFAGDLDLPPLDVNIGVIEVPEMPDVTLKFGFDELDLLVDVDIALGSGTEYTLNLFSPKTPLGFTIGDLELGVFISLDLIVKVSSAVTLGTGFHLRLDDGFTITLAMFAKEVADLEITGGQFEFLPVTIETEGVVLEAILRLGLYSSFTIESLDIFSTELGAGIEVGVFSDLARLITNVTLPTLALDDDDSDDDDEDGDDECHMNVVQEFQVGLGAEAGAFVSIGSLAWGPVPSAYTPIYVTTLANSCAFSVEASPTLEARQDEEDGVGLTTTHETEAVYTATECPTGTYINCPYSLKEVNQYTVTETLTATTAAGDDDVDWDAVAALTRGPIEAKAFGSDALSLISTSGPPVSYTPSSAADDSDHDGDGMSTGTIAGVSVGVGLAVLLGAGAGAFFFIRRRRNRIVPGSSVIHYTIPVAQEQVIPRKSVPASSDKNTISEHNGFAQD